MNTAKTGAIGFGYGSNGFPDFDTNFNWEDYLGGSAFNFGPPIGGVGNGVIFEDGSGVPTTNTGGQNPTPRNDPNDSGLSWLDKILVGWGLFNQSANVLGQGGVRTNSQGQVLTTGQNVGAANTLSQVGANVGGAAGGFTQGITTFIAQNPLLTVAVVGGAVLYFMTPPRSSRNGFKILPNPKRRRRTRRR